MYTNYDKFGVIISCRYNSKRLPGKALLKFGKYSAISLLINRIKKSNYIKNIVLATSLQKEDNHIELEAKKNNIYIFRGSLNNVLNRYVKAAQFYGIEYIIRVTGDCPFIDGELIDKCIDQCKSPESIIYSTKGNFPVGLDIEIIPTKFLEELNNNAEISDFNREHIISYFYNSKASKGIQYFDYVFSKNTIETFTLDEEVD